MSPQECIAALDAALAADGEFIILRRTAGGTNVDVTCRARVTGLTAAQIIANISVSELNVTISPTEIDAAQWPGGTAPQSPPYDVDPRIPVANTDKVIARGRLLNVRYVEALRIDDRLVRINVRVG